MGHGLRIGTPADISRSGVKVGDSFGIDQVRACPVVEVGGGNSQAASFIANGTTVTGQLRAALPSHEAGSIGMRLSNFDYLATGGASGLANAAAQTREGWEIVGKLRRPP